MGYKTIFHIDDDQDDLEFFAMAVGELSDEVKCISFTDARSAMQKLLSSEIHPDIIFLDLNMPVMNGQEFLVKIKAS